MWMCSSKSLQSRTLALALVALVGLAGAAGQAAAQSEFLVMDNNGYASPSTGKIVRYEWPSGKVVDWFVAPELSALESPHNAVYGPNGVLYVAGGKTNNIQIYDGQTGKPLGELVSPGGGGLDSPNDLIIGPDGKHLFVCSYNSGAVLKVRLSDGLITPFIPNGSIVQPAGIAYDTQGNWYVSSQPQDRVLKYNASGTFLGDAIPSGAGGLVSPRDVMIDAQQRLYVAGTLSDTVVVKDLNTNTIASLFPAGTGGLISPHYLTLSPTGDLLAVGTGGPAPANGMFLKFNRMTGAFLGEFLPPTEGGLSDQPIAIVFKPDSCYADCDGDGALSIDDFICFQTTFALGC